MGCFVVSILILMEVALKERYDFGQEKSQINSNFQTLIWDLLFAIWEYVSR